jgi:competence protein ComEA
VEVAEVEGHRTTASGGGKRSPSPAVLIVHVAGWVRRPGVYELREGDRVIDAVEAAGGARKGAYLDGLNLAAPLTDGQQVLVPKTAAPGAAPSGVIPGQPALVNINTAAAAELETLPGIGEVLAERIIDHRTEHGPFASVDDLLEVSGIGEATLEEIRELVTV